MSTPTYNANANVFGMAEGIVNSADTRGRLYSKILEVGAATRDDFTRLEGAPNSLMPFWRKKDLQAGAGDRVTFTTMAQAAGPGARGEQQLTGRTSVPRINAYTCQVDFFRDAVEFTKKTKRFLTTGASISTTSLKMLSEKMGRKKMFDMMQALKRTTNAIVLRPNARTSRDAIRNTDTLSPSFMVESKARMLGIGARPIGKTKSGSGSDVNRYLAFIGQDSMLDMRNSNSYQNAQLHAMERGGKNTLFTGALPDWQGLLFWEHQVIQEDSNDAVGSPIAPRAILGTTIASGTTQLTLTGGDGTSTLCEYFRDFPGFDYLFTEDQTAAPSSTDYFFWIYNLTGSDAGKAGFYRYTGSGNTGNTIATKNEAGNAGTGAGGRLGAAVSGNTSTKIGQVVWDAATMTDAHPIGSLIIPANQYGTPIAENFIFGAGAGLRAYGEVEAQPIKEKRDYGFVEGMGYEGIWGQRACLDTSLVPRNYVVLQSAYEVPGVTLPYIAA